MRSTSSPGRGRVRGQERRGKVIGSSIMRGISSAASASVPAARCIGRSGNVFGEFYGEEMGNVEPQMALTADGNGQHDRPVWSYDMLWDDTPNLGWNDEEKARKSLDEEGRQAFPPGCQVAERWLVRCGGCQ